MHQQREVALDCLWIQKCSLKHKIGTQEKFCNNYQPCKEVWASGQRVHKYIGYDAGETRRIQHAAPIDEADKSTKSIIRFTNGDGRAKNVCT